MNTSILIKRVLLVKNRLVISFAHHSYLVLGDEESAILAIKDSIQKEFGLDLDKFPDIYIGRHNFFGVDDSRSLKQKISNRAFAGGKKFFLISITSTTSEAQNALLKVLEEPTGDAHIFLIARTIKFFLPTVVSRCEVVDWSNRASSPADDCPEFLTQSPAERIKTIADWHKKEELTKELTIHLLDDIEKQIVASPDRSGLRALVLARRYLYDRALLPKMILEYLAVTLPQFSKTK